MNDPENVPEGRSPEPTRSSGRSRTLGLALMGVAILLWVLAAVVVFLPLPGGQKVWTTSALLIAGEVFFWISAAVLGRELFRRYRSRLDPRRLFRKDR